ncbi:MAG: hypothetical protein JW818_14085 [Pirellulales bacterium]|nr:hypothetical protein [Pirellulales bacterium]
MVASADGIVRILPGDTTPDKLRALLTIAGGEQVNIRELAGKRLYPPTALSKNTRIGLAIVWFGSLLTIIASIGRCRLAQLAAAKASTGETPVPPNAVH